MQLSDIRRENLRLLITQQFEGKAALLADRLDRQAAYISRLLTDNEAHKRNLGEKLAREIEEKCGLAPRWMDQPHTLGGPQSGDSLEHAAALPSPTATPEASPHVQELIDMLRNLDLHRSISKQQAAAFKTLFSSLEQPQKPSTEGTGIAPGAVETLSALAAKNARKSKKT